MGKNSLDVMVSSQDILLGSIHPVVDYVNLDHLVKVVSARFLHSTVKVFSFAINTYFGRGTFKCKYCVSPQTFTINFRIHQWSLPAVICCGVLMVIFYFLHYFFFYLLAGILLSGRAVSSPSCLYLLKCLLISVLSYGYLFNFMGYTPILFFFLL